MSDEDIQTDRNQINEQFRSLTESLLKKRKPAVKIGTAVSEIPLKIYSSIDS